MDEAIRTDSQTPSETSSTASASPTPEAPGCSTAPAASTSHSELWTVADLEAYARDNGYRITLLNLTSR